MLSLIRGAFPTGAEWDRLGVSASLNRDALAALSMRVTGSGAEVPLVSAYVALSGYRDEMYDVMLDGWKRYEFDMPNNAGQGAHKGRRTECLWVNW